MGNKQSTARPAKTREGTTNPPPYSESAAKEKTSSLPADSKPLEKSGQKGEEIKTCKRCRTQFLESQLENNLTSTKCGRYHPTVSSSGRTRIQTRREAFLERNNVIPPTYPHNQSNSYYDALVWSCCIQPCLPHEMGGYLHTNGCMYHDGKHEA